MAEAWEIETRGRQRESQIRLQADLRRQDRITSEQFDVEIEKIKGDNDRELSLLQHDLDKENRVLDLRFQEFKNAQQVRLEAIQTAIKQQDDFFRHFWDIDKEIVRLETRIIELVVAARITAEQSILDHQHAMDAKNSEQGHELVTLAEERKRLELVDHLDKGNFEFKERLKIQLAREFGMQSTDQINAAVEKLTRQGKI